MWKFSVAATAALLLNSTVMSGTPSPTGRKFMLPGTIPFFCMHAGSWHPLTVVTSLGPLGVSISSISSLAEHPKVLAPVHRWAVCVELCNTIAWHIQRQRSLTFACVVCSTWASLTRPIWHLSANVLHDQLTISGIIESPGPTAPDVVPQIPVKKRHIVVGFIVRICRPNLYRKV